MTKIKMKGLNRFDFVKMVIDREKRIGAAPAKKLPELSSYRANIIADALHPAVQYLTVAEVIVEKPDVKTFILLPDKEKGTKSLAYCSAGQYIVIQLTVGKANISRPYSLSSSPKEASEGKYALTIKRVDGGLASQFILDNWTVGSKVTASAPMGDFTYEPLRDAKKLVGLAGGSGITPFFSLAKAIADGTEDAELTLLYGSRTQGDVLFLEKFRAIEKTCDKFKLINVISDGEGEEKGFLTAELIKKYAPSGDYSVFVCGPQAMYDFVDKEIAKLGLRRKFIRHELFGEYRNPAKNADYPQLDKDSSFKLTVRICGEERTVPCLANDTLLVSMEKNGISAPADCRSGMCGWCHSRLISGDVYVPKSVDGRRLADLKYGYVHPCCTFPLGDVAIDVPPVKG